jgi:hypothetical protein
MTSALQDREGGWLVDLGGWRVDRCSFDFQTRLLFFYPPEEKTDIDGTFEIVLETPFRLSLPDGEESQLDPNGPREALAPVLGLFQTTVDEAFVEEGGTLNVVFREGGHLCSQPHPDYEAWQLYGPGLLIVCMPGGGEPAIWLNRS